MRLSIIVPAKHESSAQRLLDHWIDDGISSELLFVGPFTGENLDPHDANNVTVIEAHEPSWAMAAQAGARESQGDFLVFSYVDAMPEPGWLRGLLNLHDVGIAHGLPMAEGEIVEPFAPRPSLFVFVPFLIHAGLFCDLGGFYPRQDAEMDLGNRVRAAGYDVWVQPQSIVRIAHSVERVATRTVQGEFTVEF